MWSNYYVQGLEWLASQPPRMDGIYLDGVAYDRITMKRCRKVLDAAKHGCLIDMHSGNNFDPRYGLVSPALQYMMLMPYMDSLMLGEGFQTNYDLPAGVQGGGPDYWLVEVSGLPFGLMSDMLGHSDSQLWRGFVFGCVTRLPYSHVEDNKQVWAVWDHYQLDIATMVGWWDSNPPVRTVPPPQSLHIDGKAALCGSAIVATAYVLQGVHTLISVASWANETTVCDFEIDWEVLGLQPKTGSRAVAPPIPAVYGSVPTGFWFQNASSFAIDGNRIKSVPLVPSRGWLIELR